MIHLGLLAGALALTLVSHGIPCGPRDAVIRKLSAVYQEAQTARGFVGANVIVEVWANTKTGTWTILRTTPDGFSCVIAAGEFWRSMTPAAPGDDN